MCASVPFRVLLRTLPAAVLVAAASAPAQAQDGPELFTAETLSASGDIRLGGADGEASWIDGGYGKTRFDAHDADGKFHVRPWLAEADLVWQPRFTWSLTGNVVVTAQHGQDDPVDISEAALTFKPLVGNRTRVAVRAGLFWPPVSLEHSGPEWAVTNTGIHTFRDQQLDRRGSKGRCSRGKRLDYARRQPLYGDAGGVRAERHIGHPARLPRLGAARREGDRVEPPAAAAARQLHAGRPGAQDSAGDRDRPSPGLVRQARLVALAGVRAGAVPL